MVLAHCPEPGHQCRWAARPRLAAYGLIAAFIFVERRLRRGHAASTLEALPSDRGTTRVIGATYGYALSAGLLAPVLSNRGIGRLPTGSLQAFGIGVMVAGLLLRIWAALTLGRFYTRTLRVSSDQTVVRTGPYRFLRHPGYAADLALWLGFGLASGNANVAFSVASAMALAYVRRIDAEEDMLARELGEPYRRYLRESWRVLPWVY